MLRNWRCSGSSLAIRVHACSLLVMRLRVTPCAELNTLPSGKAPRTSINRVIATTFSRRSITAAPMSRNRR